VLGDEMYYYLPPNMVAMLLNATDEEVARYYTEYLDPELYTEARLGDEFLS